MKTKTFLWALIAVLVVVVLALAFRPAGGGSGKGGIVNVDAAGVRDAISAGAQVIDVRTPGEFSMGHVEGAVNVPVEQVATAAQGWDKNATYVVYCATGARSATAVDSMRSMGFNNIKHFSAGIQAWDGKLVQGAEQGSQKIQTSGKPVMLEFYTDS